MYTCINIYTYACIYTCICIYTLTSFHMLCGEGRGRGRGFVVKRFIRCLLLESYLSTRWWHTNTYTHAHTFVWVYYLYLQLRKWDHAQASWRNLALADGIHTCIYILYIYILHVYINVYTCIHKHIYTYTFTCISRKRFQWFVYTCIYHTIHVYKNVHTLIHTYILKFISRRLIAVIAIWHLHLYAYIHTGT